MPNVTTVYDKISVIGSGAWGTALGVAAAQAGRTVTLWAREEGVVESINSKHENVLFLPGAALPTALSASRVASR